MTTRKYEWDKKSRAEKLSAVMYPQLTSETTRREMSEIARGERRKPPAPSPLLSHETRGATSPLGGQAQPRKR
jgi:hypothetical protein